MYKKRLERILLFENFQNSELNFFEEKKENGDKYKKFDDYYSLCICPKGRNGGVSKRLYEVFYGRRIYEVEEQIRSDFSSQKKTLTETGCTLSFGLNDHGYVAVMLYPGKTDYTSQLETCIFIENYLHPKKLSKRKFLERQWRYLNSYMEITSIDGAPTIVDKIRVFYLRYFKNKIIDEKYLPKPIFSAFLTSLKFVVNIGLSGFLIYFITIFPNKKEDNIEFLKSENNELKIENVSLKNKIEYLNTIDSLKTIINSKDKKNTEE